MPHLHWDDPDDSIINLLLQIPYIQPDEAPVACAWSIDENPDLMGENYREAEAKYREEVEDYIRSFCTGMPLPGISLEAQYFVGVRASVIQPFVIQLGISHGSPIKTVFLHPPDMTIQETAQWLLIDWWDTFGPSEATKSRVVDERYGI